MDTRRLIKGILLSMAIASLTGCSTTGGDIGGLVPAPKFLKGSIDNGVYTAQDKRFTVAVPHAQGSYEYSYMQVKEQYGQNEAYVSFGPAAFDQSIYRVDLVTAPVGQSMPNLNTVAPRILGGVEQQAQTAYGSAATADEGSRVMIAGHNAYRWELKQTVPAGKLANVSVDLVHSVYLIDFGVAMATVWVQNPIDIPTGKGLTPDQFAESVKVAAPAPLAH